MRYIACFLSSGFLRRLHAHGLKFAAPTVGVVVELYPCSCQVRQTSRRGVVSAPMRDFIEA